MSLKSKSPAHIICKSTRTVHGFVVRNSDRRKGAFERIRVHMYTLPLESDEPGIYREENFNCINLTIQPGYGQNLTWGIGSLGVSLFVTASMIREIMRPAILITVLTVSTVLKPLSFNELEFLVAIFEGGKLDVSNFDAIEDDVFCCIPAKES